MKTKKTNFETRSIFKIANHNKYLRFAIISTFPLSFLLVPLYRLGFLSSFYFSHYLLILQILIACLCYCHCYVSIHYSCNLSNFQSVFIITSRDESIVDKKKLFNIPKGKCAIVYFVISEFNVIVASTHTHTKPNNVTAFSSHSNKFVSKFQI